MLVIKKHPSLSVNAEIQDIEETLRIRPVLEQMRFDETCKKWRDQKIENQSKIIAVAQTEIVAIHDRYAAAPDRLIDLRKDTSRLERRLKLLQNKTAVERLAALTVKLEKAVG